MEVSVGGEKLEKAVGNLSGNFPDNKEKESLVSHDWLCSEVTWHYKNH